MGVEWLVSSCAMILLVVQIRFLFRKKMQPRIRYALWLAVVLRLLVPVSFSATTASVLNLLPEQAEEGTDQGRESAVNPPKMKDAGISQIGEAAETIRKEMDAEGQWDRIGTEQSPVQEPAVEAMDIWEGQTGEEKEQASKGLFQLKDSKMNVGRALWYVWLFGAVLCGIVLLAVNLDYSRRLRRSRKRIAKEKLPVFSWIPVYTAEMIQTPCLIGLFRPAVYVTENVAGEEKTFSFVLCHENVHYLHHDNWWVLVRNLCLCLHWYNPLVWLAACLSRQDGELACDEKVLELLGREAGKDYGRTLLEISTAKLSGINGWRISTTMGGNKRQLSERLRMIVDMPKKAVGVRILLLILMALVFAVAFTGRAGKGFAASNQDGRETEAEQSDSFGEQPQEADGADLFAEKPEEGTGKAEEGSALAGEPDGADVQTEEFYQEHPSAGGDIDFVLDLNFDGWDDQCIPRQHDDNGNVLYQCMLWDQQIQQYVQSVMIYNIDTDTENKWITSRMQEENGQRSTTYYRYDENDQLHMIRYTEENQSPDAVFERLDLTYVEDGSMYTLLPIVDETDLHRTLIAMAKQSLTELYWWTGEKIDTSFFQVSNMGGVSFGITKEDIIHSRIFFSRWFGADTEYNLSDNEKCISSIDVASGRKVWFSPVLWRVFPDRIDEMTDEEIITWYLEHIPTMDDCKVKSIEKRYEDMWTVQAQSGVWFEVVYDAGLREVSSVYGPYPDYPVH